MGEDFCIFVRPEEAVARYVRKWAGKDPKAPEIRPFRTKEHAGIVFEPKIHLHDVDFVLVPGWTSLGDGMAKLGYILSRMGFRAHVLHLPGQGGPGKPEEVYDYVRKYVERLRCPVFLVGHSMGGEIVKWVSAKNIVGRASLAPAGPRKGWLVADYLGALLSPLVLWYKARRMGVDEALSFRAPLKYVQIVRRFGGYEKGALFLGSRDILIPYTDEFYHYKRKKGFPPYLEVVRGGHGFFADKRNIRTVAERLAQLALGLTGKR